MMNIKGRNLLIVAGVISTVLGLLWMTPSFIKEVYWLSVVASLFVIGGIILLALGFGEEREKKFV